eukprot:6988274-Pyramimonas_sp.AAC.1
MDQSDAGSTSGIFSRWTNTRCVWVSSLKESTPSGRESFPRSHDSTPSGRESTPQILPAEAAEVGEYVEKVVRAEAAVNPPLLT